MRKEKIIVFCIALLLFCSSISYLVLDTVIGNTGDLSDEGDNDVNISETYIHQIAMKLSNITFQYPTGELVKGRAFGSWGEQYAAEEILQDEMIDLGLYNPDLDPPYLEQITGTTQHPDLNKTLDVLSRGIKINGTESIDCYISPQWNTTIFRLIGWADYDKNLLTFNFSYDNLEIHHKPSFPQLEELFMNAECMENLSQAVENGTIVTWIDFIKFVLNCFQDFYDFTFMNLNQSNVSSYPSYFNGEWPQEPLCEPYVYIEEDPQNNPNVSVPTSLNSWHPLSLPRVFYKTAKILLQMILWRWTHPFCVGLIRFDFNNDTYDMVTNQDLRLPILYINGTKGKLINDSVSDYTISFWIDQRYSSMESYNVIGQINGTDRNKTVLLTTLYDSWWNQGTADSAIGTGIVISIARFFKEHGITPKYTLKFIAFGGEELGALGAYYYNDTYLNENITTVIDLNQLGFRERSDQRLTFHIVTNNETLNATIKEIMDEANYIQRTGNISDTGTGILLGGGPSNTLPFAESCLPDKGNRSISTILFLKDTGWTLHHRNGNNYNEGDVIKYYNDTDIRVTSEIIWNITKYFAINPYCWFSNVTFTAFDSPNDGDTLNDSIRANYTIHSILPQDLNQVQLDLGYENETSGGMITNIDQVDYIVTSDGTQQSYTFTIPDDTTTMNYSLSFKLYNSTGRINKIVYNTETSNYNDTSGSSPSYTLYHPFGYPTTGDQRRNIEDTICGSDFIANENGVAQNITVYVQADLSIPPTKSKCIIYHTNGTLLGTTEEVNPAGGAQPHWVVYNFTGTQPIIQKGTHYVLVCWSDDNCNFYYDTFTDERGHTNQTDYGTPPNPIYWTSNESRLYSIYCNYRPDNVPPKITNISHDPTIVGFGYNITINADVTDNVSGFDHVNVSITYPDETTNNYSMTHKNGDHYQLIFNDTWLVGQYNYTIRATDNAYNTNTSTDFYFNVSANTTIHICTLKDNYRPDEYINLTDPPINPEPYLYDRGLTWDRYYNPTDNTYNVVLSETPMNYQTENHSWTPINCTLQTLTPDTLLTNQGYHIGNQRGLYSLYIKNNLQDTWPIAFAYNKSTRPDEGMIRMRPLSIGYLDPSQHNTYQALQHIQETTTTVTDDQITYHQAYTGIDLTLRYTPTSMKEELILNTQAREVFTSHPPSTFGLSDTESLLVFQTQVELSGLHVFADEVEQTGDFTLDHGTIILKDDHGMVKCGFPVGVAYEQTQPDNNVIQLMYRFIAQNNNYYLFCGLTRSEVLGMVFPIVIDPTITKYASTDDGHIYKADPNYNMAHDAGSGTISASGTYFNVGQKCQFGIPMVQYVYRGFVHFNTSIIPDNATITATNLTLYGYADYSDTDFDVIVQNGQPTYPHMPLQSSDYSYVRYSGDGGSVNTSGFSVGGGNVFTFNLTGRTWINTTGYTKLCLRSNRDINSLAPPDDSKEYVSFYSSTGGKTMMPKLIVSYAERNQSKINNTGETNISGYLQMKVQYYHTASHKWYTANLTVNESTPRMILTGEQLGLDTIFNGKVNTTDLYDEFGDVLYRVYAEFRDPDGHILVCDDETELVATWEFIINS